MTTMAEELIRSFVYRAFTFSLSFGGGLARKKKVNIRAETKSLNNSRKKTCELKNHYFQLFYRVGWGRSNVNQRLEILFLNFNAPTNSIPIDIIKSIS